MVFGGLLVFVTHRDGLEQSKLEQRADAWSRASIPNCLVTALGKKLQNLKNLFLLHLDNYKEH